MAKTLCWVRIGALATDFAICSLQWILQIYSQKSGFRLVYVYTEITNITYNSVSRNVHLLNVPLFLIILARCHFFCPFISPSIPSKIHPTIVSAHYRWYASPSPHPCSRHHHSIFCSVCWWPVMLYNLKTWIILTRNRNPSQRRKSN